MRDEVAQLRSNAAVSVIEFASQKVFLDILFHLLAIVFIPLLQEAVLKLTAEMDLASNSLNEVQGALRDSVECLSVEKELRARAEV